MQLIAWTVMSNKQARINIAWRTQEVKCLPQCAKCMQHGEGRLVIDRSVHRPQPASKCVCEWPSVLQRSPSNVITFLFLSNNKENLYVQKRSLGRPCSRGCSSFTTDTQLKRFHWLPRDESFKQLSEEHISWDGCPMKLNERAEWRGTAGPW